MSESLLKKEFKKSDVNRIRNLISKNVTSNTSIKSGYNKKTSFYKEGDVWTEKDRTWTIKNGIKQNISKLQEAKKAIKIPFSCPKCNQSMNYWLHKKMYKIHGFCFDCTIEYESELRKAGLYEKYEQSMIKGGIKKFLEDLESWIEEEKNNLNSFVTEEGDIEDWKSNSKVHNSNLDKLKKFIENSKTSL